MSDPDLAVAIWPPAPLVTERLVLTEKRPDDRNDLVELRCSEPTFRYLGGPASREEAERLVGTPTGWPAGAFVIRRPSPHPAGAEAQSADVEGIRFVGVIDIERRPPEQPGHVADEGDELELSYTLHPDYWGQGFADEAARAVLGWAASTFTDELVIAVTQAANERSIRLLRRLGFTERDRFQQFGAEQSLNVAELSAYR